MDATSTDQIVTAINYLTASWQYAFFFALAIGSIVLGYKFAEKFC